MINMKVDIKFLESKEFEIKNPWNYGAPMRVYASSGNIDRISDSVFKFTEYNFLPADEKDILDGHYTFFVNYKTFEYLVYKSSDYGNLITTIPCNFETFLTNKSLPEFSKKRVEAKIASKLLGAYFHDSNAIHRKGKNLFSDGTPPEEAGINIYDEKYYRYTDGSKRNLICDYRAYSWVDHIQIYSDIELKALELLCGYKQPNVNLSENEIKKITNKIRCNKKETKTIQLDINGKEYKIIHNKPEIGKSNILLALNDKVISKDFMCNNITRFIRNIPIMINNYATL